MGSGEEAGSSGPDRDSARLGALARLSIAADDIHREAEVGRRLSTRAYRSAQNKLLKQAQAVLKRPGGDGDELCVSRSEARPSPATVPYRKRSRAFSGERRSVRGCPEAAAALGARIGQTGEAVSG